VVRFVDSDFRGEKSMRELGRIFPDAPEAGIEMEPMPLRAIFLAIAKSARTQGHGPHTANAETRSQA
jgi:hypothetical protein